jgi:CRISPR-associated protein Csh1
MDEERRSLPQNRKLVESKLEEFFHHHNITNLAKKASFLVGALVDYLLKVQREERKVGFGEEPFWDKIHSLMLDERKVKKLFGQAIGKLRQYRRGYPALEELAGRYLMDSGEGWNLSSDEVSYYFTLGLTLSKNLILKHEQASVIEESGSHG